jgi:hypothetical protein
MRTSITSTLSAVFSSIGLVLLPSACGDDSTTPPGNAAIDGATAGDVGNGSADSIDSPVIAPGLDASQDAPQTDASDGAPTMSAPDGTTDGANGGLDPGVLAIMRRVADWQLLQPGINAIDWIHGAM